MVIRTYFSKDNIIIKDSQVNLGKNPIVEMFYGGTPNTHSRYIFQFDDERIKKEVQCGILGDINNLKHTLKLTSTASLNENLLGTENCQGKKRTNSFNLVVFKINQPWDEGHGFDNRVNSKDTNSLFSNCASNWVFSKSNITWDVSGTFNNYFTGNSSEIGVNEELIDYVGFQEFNLGSENIEIDLTTTINKLLIGEEPNYGYGLAFSGNLETIETNIPNFTSYFGRNTNTFFEPFIETSTIIPLKDDRSNFNLNINQQLCIYPSINGENICLDEKPKVVIKNQDGEIVTDINSNEVIKFGSGYCVNFNLTGTTNNSCETYTDEWSNIIIDGIDNGIIENEFFINDNNKVKFNTTLNNSKDLIVKLTGIKREERILIGDVRKVNVITKVPYSSTQQQVVNGLEYRLYVREGNSEVTVIDYHPVDRGSESNFFYLDTNSLIPNTYYIDIKTTSNKQVKQLKNILRFEIINESNYRNIYR